MQNWTRKVLHWLGLPVPDELGDASAVPPGTIRIDASGRPFQSVTGGRRRPNTWSRRWLETPEQAKRRAHAERLLLLCGGMYHGVLVGVFLVAAVEGWSWNGNAVSPLVLMLPGLVAVLTPRVWRSMVLPSPAGSGLQRGQRA